MLTLFIFGGGCIEERSKGGVEGAFYKSEFSDNRPLKIIEVKILKERLERYNLFEAILDIEGAYLNPFDPEEINIEGYFQDPEGEEVAIPGFFYQEYKMELKEDYEVLTPVDKPHFRIRFSPTKIGTYNFYVKVKDRNGEEISNRYEFQVVDSENPGFVRVSKEDFHYFEFENGKSFIPVGANVCWAGAKGTFDYDTWLPEYAKVGGNYFRVWLGPNWTTFALERNSVREYDLRNAWRLDYVLDLAHKLNMYVMFCFDSYNELRYQREGAYPYWEYTPHNKKNGGPLDKPREFWTNKEMLRYYKNKLRYIVARYGYSTNVLAWEFWNEVDIISPTAFVLEEVKNWHDEMSKYLKGIDPWKHLLTTSFAYSPGKPEIDSLPGIDYVQTHIYQSKAYMEALASLIEYKERYKKPHLIGECGLDAGGNDPWIDPQGYAIHNAIWTAILSGSCGTAMSWWWDNHIHPDNLYFHYDALAKFIKDIEFAKEDFRRVKDYKINANTKLSLFGLRGKNYILLWIYKPEEAYTYKKDLPKISPENVLGTIDLSIQGRFKVSTYDTYKGELVKEDLISSEDRLSIPLVDFERDMAVKIKFLE
ncbi:MAG TPA: DUF5060 domain-containing protein [Dictyoglomaceae bacterium]|nr:DUF5060 domain-containing protein [Dictyoglomaceae bacterium]HPU43569.1 DUF5060 domain-containing protein [Dictyoglomaceae bacterium]